MPNSPRGGGISRKITSAADRRRLKEITAELDIPQGMGLIVRTAGANRPKPEIRRDCEYLMRLWDDIREHTMASMAPALIYEEASLIKRTIRDVYSRDIDEVYVDGETGWRAAHDFMRMLMPSHARKVQLWKPREQGGVPLFARYQVDTQLDAMLSPNVPLKSGGYLVINQAEALVAIDVNSGRSTRERGIEETALRTNLEAAEEVARQLRLRDLAGLIVIDFIDMDAKKHNAMVENRLKEALKSDRARIQLGHISHFGLMEMSRQRLRPSLAETSFVTCPHCQGLGLVRGVESSAMHVLRDIEEEGAKERASLIMVHVATPVAMYLLNNKREALAAIERRCAMAVHFTGDDSLRAPEIRIDRLKPPIPAGERVVPGPVAPLAPQLDLPDEDSDAVADEEAADETEAEAGEARVIEAGAARAAPGAAQPGGDEPQRRRRRRRRRSGRREDGGTGAAGEAGQHSDDDSDADDDATADVAADAEADAPAAAEAEAGEPGDGAEPAADELDENGNPRGRKRGRRGGRRRRRDHGDDAPAQSDAAAEPAELRQAQPRPAESRQIPIQPAAPYTGPTPANPFGSGAVLDIFDLMDRVEEAATQAPAAAPPEPAETAPAMTPAAPPVELPVEPPVAGAPAGEPAAAEPIAPEAEAAPKPRTRATRAPSARTLAARAAKAARAEAAAQAAAAEAATAAPAGEPAAEAAAPEPVVPEPVAAEPVAAEPVAAEPATADVATAEPAAPAIRPLLVGEDVTPGAAPKRGWWRR
jgi:ribonuclease E